MGIEMRFARAYWERLTDQIGAQLQHIQVRIDHEREWMRLCEMRNDDNGADDCLDEIAKLERDWIRLKKDMPEEDI